MTSAPVGGTVVATRAEPHVRPRADAPPVALPWPRLLPALTSGLLLFASFFPLACGWLAWVALVPLLCLVRSDATRKRVFFCGLLGGLAFFIPALQWMRVADVRMYATWIGLALACALFVPVGVLLLRVLDRRTRLPLTFTLPIVWVALEFLRSHIATGFGWYLLGQSQHDFLTIIQVADFGSAYAVTILVAAANGLVFELLFAWRPFRTFFALPVPGAPRWSRALQTGLVVVMIAAALGYGTWRLNETTFEKGPRIALVQSNLDLRLKMTAWSSEPGAKNAGQAMFSHQIRLTDIAAAQRPELIVWAETTWPESWLMDQDEETGELGVQSFSQETADFSAQRWRAPVLFGMNTAVRRPGKRVREQYNSAVLIGADGRYGGRYDKMHCVPFGEYIPLRNLLPVLGKLSPYDFDYSVTPGEHLTRFPVGKHHFGVVICYEDTITDLAPAYSLPEGDQAPVDFLVNASNDGWFAGTPEHEQHLAIARFRAIESRRSLGRAVNMGVSALIDPNGRVLAPVEKETIDDVRVWEIPENASDLPIGRWHEFKTVPGVLFATVPIDHRTTVYARFGDWLPWTCSGLLGLLLLMTLARKKRIAFSSH